MQNNYLCYVALSSTYDLTVSNFDFPLQVMLKVAPDSLYDEFLTKVFKDSLFRMSVHPSATFVVRALINYTKTKDHVRPVILLSSFFFFFVFLIVLPCFVLLWTQVMFIFNLLGSHFWTFFKSGKSGVVASLLAACERHRICEPEVFWSSLCYYSYCFPCVYVDNTCIILLQCCRAVADAVCPESGSSEGIVPRILFLSDYIHARDKSNWRWPSLRVVDFQGSDILHSIFSLPSVCGSWDPWYYVTCIMLWTKTLILETVNNHIVLQGI